MEKRQKKEGIVLKRLASMMALMMLFCSISTPAFADEDKKADVKVSTNGADPHKTYNPGDEYAMLSVEVQWEDAHFTYHFGEEWDAESHSYKAADGQKLGWDKTQTSVTVRNHSNIAVDVKVAFEKSQADVFKSVDVTLDKTEAHLESAVGKTMEETPTEVFTFTVSGEPSGTIDTYDSIGTASVYINGAVASTMEL